MPPPPPPPLALRLCAPPRHSAAHPPRRARLGLGPFRPGGGVAGQPALAEDGGAREDLYAVACGVAADCLKYEGVVWETIKSNTGYRQGLTWGMPFTDSAYAQYRRRYVIRVRAETDQFLLSCVGPESSTATRLAYTRDNTALVSSRSSRPAPVIHHSAMTPHYPYPSSQLEPTSHLTPTATSLSNLPPLLSQIPLEQLTTRRHRHPSPTTHPSPSTSTAAAAGDGKWRPRHE
ncbi:PH domain-containing protein [Apiospora rasikravindrae]|uniref:PH domain-containing protein n=1 Tax=Apiospora rasikravindrae TaxID=990691 RepID=A0ABR1SKB3_9PEZI